MFRTAIRRLLPTMNATLLLLNLGYLGGVSVEAVEYISEGTCSPSQQREILAGRAGCQARDTLVDLREHLPNASNVIQVIPDFATISRCGGSCDMYSHSCVPTATRTRRLEVMVVLSQFPQVQTETQCGFVEVEEHIGCACDCPVQSHHCRSEDQYYEPGSCRCLCRDQVARNECIVRGMQWDPVNCMCICPMASWKVCSTGYMFDFRTTCQCVPVSTTASLGLMVAVAVLLTCTLITSIGIYVMYRSQTGLFRIKSGSRVGSTNAAAAVFAAATGGVKTESNYNLVMKDADLL